MSYVTKCNSGIVAMLGVVFPPQPSTSTTTTNNNDTYNGTKFVLPTTTTTTTTTTSNDNRHSNNSSSIKLCNSSQNVINMLNSNGYEKVMYCISDPNQIDCPIIFASDEFVKYTQYTRNEIIGRNCRFLQGPNTNQEDVDKIRIAIKEEKEVNVKLINHKKDGTIFTNDFFISPLYDINGKLVLFIGVQCPVIPNINNLTF